MQLKEVEKKCYTIKKRIILKIVLFFYRFSRIFIYLCCVKLYTMNKNLITCPNGIPERKKEWYVFLAGPIQGAPDWQFDMPDIKNVIWLSPRRKTYDDFDYEEQTSW